MIAEKELESMIFETLKKFDQCLMNETTLKNFNAVIEEKCAMYAYNNLQEHCRDELKFQTKFDLNKCKFEIVPGNLFTFFLLRDGHPNYDALNRHIYSNVEGTYEFDEKLKFTTYKQHN